MLFANGTKGLTLDRESLSVRVVDVVDGDWGAADVIVHHPANKMIAHMLIDMPFGPFPMALGVIYEDPAPTFESAVAEQNAQASAGKIPDLQKLVGKGQSWMVEKEPHAI
jgi:2-oxoglutarate/2-oxoacid ferredoxin oxidoreductase subunit beta